MTFNKFGAKRASLDGRSFASQGERDCYSLLKLQEKAGEITLVSCQETVYLTLARIAYIADFRIRDLKTQEDIWIEYKGFETPEWRLKKRLWKFYGPGKLRVYKGSGLRMIVVEEIIPDV